MHEQMDRWQSRADQPYGVLLVEMSVTNVRIAADKAVTVAVVSLAAPVGAHSAFWLSCRRA